MIMLFGHESGLLRIMAADPGSLDLRLERLMPRTDHKAGWAAVRTITLMDAVAIRLSTDGWRSDGCNELTVLLMQRAISAQQAVNYVLAALAEDELSVPAEAEVMNGK
jgi:hypothetical protein